MSNFTERLMSTKNGRVVHVPALDSVLKLEESITDLIHGELGHLYEIKATFHAQYAISASDLTHAKHERDVIKNTKRRIVEAVFGEFRQPLLEIRNAIHNRELHKALDILTILENDMFEV